MWRNLRHRSSEQGGFTLLEVIVSLAIASFLVTSVSMAFMQITMITVQSRSHMQAVRQVQTAGYWVSRDSHMAKEVNPQPPQSSPVELPWQLTFTWEDITGASQYKAVYTITADQVLERAYYINDVQQGGVIVIAEHIVSDWAQTYYDTSVAYGAVFGVTASVGGITETRVYDVLSRLYVPA